MNLLEIVELKKIERIKDLLQTPEDRRVEKMLLELMTFTKDFKLFENLAMSTEHKNICRTMTLINYKTNEVIVQQGEPGDSFFYILSGLVKIVVSKKIEITLNSQESNVTVDKYIGDLKPGQTFGELSLLYGTDRTATIIAVKNSSFIKIDKISFDKYVKDLFENQLRDQIDFIKICPIFHKLHKDSLVKLAVNSERKYFGNNQIIIQNKLKSEFIYIIRRGNVKVIKPIDFIKDENKIKKKLNDYRNVKGVSYEDLKYLKEINEDKLIEILSNGPKKADYENNNIINKNISLETLKMGDIFPTYYSVNNLQLDVFYEADNPCEVIMIKIHDLQEIAHDSYNFIQSFAKPYPNDEFLRKFYFYNHIWSNFKKALKHNIVADGTNKNLLKKNAMRQKLSNKRDIDSIILPSIFSNKKFQYNISSVNKK